MAELKPLFARVLLKREKAEKIGSVFLPGDAAKRHASLKCKVLAIGPTADESIRVGSTVLIGRYAGDWLDSSGNVVPEGEYYIAQDEDLLCEVEE